jgi:hypothetical protein
MDFSPANARADNHLLFDFADRTETYHGKL